MKENLKIICSMDRENILFQVEATMKENSKKEDLMAKAKENYLIKLFMKEILKKEKWKVNLKCLHQKEKSSKEHSRTINLLKVP